ncbi:hypothetical protein C1645_838715 [Glomus cerebriforme]|uniref:HMG box domain-containing protein n=1 Tax=Glomus cerebriforme TaxID=658196 RepID=A0A397SCH9_9GLOM|nr:hypothetical protein C1645_838715 [Glomus cerebriforme]
MSSQGENNLIQEMQPITYSFNQEKNKRPSNSFFLFRKEMLNNRKDNTKITDYNKSVSQIWQCMFDKEKNDFKKQYEINHECSRISSIEEIVSFFNFLLLPSSTFNEPSFNEISYSYEKNLSNILNLNNNDKLLIMERVEDFGINQYKELTPDLLGMIYYDMYSLLTYIHNSVSFVDFMIYFFDL